MYEFYWSTRFRRDVRRCERQQKPFKKFKVIVDLLKLGKPLPSQNYDHNLSGNWIEHRECHIEPDWLLIYRVNEDENIIELVRMGSQSDLF